MTLHRLRRVRAALLATSLASCAAGIACEQAGELDGAIAGIGLGTAMNIAEQATVRRHLNTIRATSPIGADTYAAHQRGTTR